MCTFPLYIQFNAHNELPSIKSMNSLIQYKSSNASIKYILPLKRVVKHS